MEYVIETSGLTKNFGKKTVVDHIDMHIEKGDIYGFIGKNGAGKTTLMKMLCGIISTSEGSYKLLGLDDPEAARKKIGSLIENPPVFNNMTARDNLIYFSKLHGTSIDRVNELLDMVGLDEAAGKKKAGALSLGMKQRLSIAIAMLNDPELLILDEPINGLDPAGIVEVRQFLMKLNKEKNITILISSHILGELEKMATKYGIINEGKLIKEITAEALYEECYGENATVNKEVNITISENDSEKVKKLLEENGISIHALENKHFDIEEYCVQLMNGGAN